MPLQGCNRIFISKWLISLLTLAISGVMSQAFALDACKPLVAKETLNKAIGAGSGYLAAAIDEDGKFEYRINLDPTLVVEKKYNILRHAGSIYALAQVYERAPDPELLMAMKRAARFMKAETLAPVPGEEGRLAIWSKHDLNNTGKPDQAKLGGAGLGLVALVSLERLAPGTTDLEELRGVARFILSMQKENGSFYSKYFAEGGRDDLWTSLFYPGEAALGLIMLYEIDPDPAWLKGAVHALEYLARTRQGRASVPVDNWALIASGRLLAIDPGDVEVDRRRIEAHAIQIVEEILRARPTPTENDPIISFVPNGRTTPTATRVEGLVASLDVISNEQAQLRRRIECAIEEGVAFLMRAQVQVGRHRGAMPRAIRRLDPAPHHADFNRRATEVRIDYVQHALSAYVGYEDAIAERSPPMN